MSASTPGPTFLELLCKVPALRRDILGTHLALQREYGDVVRIPLRPSTYLLNDPEDIKHVLVTNQQNYRKVGPFIDDDRLIGQGLFSSEEPQHMRNRRMIQPAFHHEQIASFADMMVATGQEHCAYWREGHIINLPPSMMQMTLAIVGKVLFTVDLTDKTNDLTQAWNEYQHYITSQQHFPLYRFIPTPGKARYRRALQTLDKTVRSMITERRRSTALPNDLLTTLLGIRYEDGSGMSDTQIRDEVVTFLIAGHETTGSALSWTLVLLAQHPEIEARVADEVKTVLGTGTPTPDDVSSLQYTERTFWEALRLYPPAWNIARRAVGKDTLPGATAIPAGAIVSMIQYVAHRNPRYFDDPDRFNPDRFAPSNQNGRPQFSYFPFGGGTRYCIGEPFARMEAVLLLAMIAQRFRLEFAPGQAVVPEPLITLRPRSPLLMRIRERKL